MWNALSRNCQKKNNKKKLVFGGESCSPGSLPHGHRKTRIFSFRARENASWTEHNHAAGNIMHPRRGILVHRLTRICSCFSVFSFFRALSPPLIRVCPSPKVWRPFLLFTSESRACLRPASTSRVKHLGTPPHHTHTRT